jgi:signal transduction histidine kinase
VSSAKNPVNSVDSQLEFLSKVNEAIDKVNIDSIKLKYLSELSLRYRVLNQNELFLQSNNEMLSLAQELSDSLRLGEAYWDKGAYYDSPRIGNRDSAYAYFGKAQKIFENIGETLYSARLLRSMAIIQTKVHDNTGALVTLTKAIELLKPLNEYKRLYESYNTMGIASGALKEYDNALKYYQLAKEYLMKAELGNIELASLENNIGYALYDMGNFEKARVEYKKAISHDSIFILRPDLYAKLLDHLAMTNFKLGDMSAVEDNLYRSQYIRDSIGDLEGLSLNYYNLAVVSNAFGKRADAFIFAGNARELAREIDNNLRYMESLKLLAQLDPENANIYNSEYIRISDSLLQEERRIRNKFDRIRFETEETESRNEQLARQRLIWIGIAVGLMLFALALSIIVIQRIKNQRLRFQQQQQEANQEIFNLMLSQKQKMEEGKQSEQKRISEELHDGILGEMNGVRMILLGLNKKGDDASIAIREQAIEKLKEVQEEIRSISHELSDSSYQKFNNFINSIDELLKTSCESGGINYHFTYDQDLDWDNLEGVTKINLYRILQESLQNCIKHAEATSVYVSFEIDGSDMVITIQDNGRGFDTGKGKKGIGHRNIESRIRKIRGKWYLRSAPGIGTTVLLEIPLEHISPEAKKEISLPKDLQEA